jgi:hypothetical protein
MRLSENVFLIPAADGLLTLARLVDIADETGFPSRALCLAEAPQWLSTPRPES